MGEAETRWETLARGLVAGRKIILAGSVLAAWTPRVEALTELGASGIPAVGTGQGTGPPPDPALASTVCEDVRSASIMEQLAAKRRTITEPPVEVRAAIDVNRVARTLHLDLVNRAVIAGMASAASAADFERDAIRLLDAERGGGAWTSARVAITETRHYRLVRADATFRRAGV